MSEINDNTKLQHDQMRQKISISLENLNKSTFAFDEMISDYNSLYKKYTDMQMGQEQNPRKNTMSFSSNLITKKSEKNDEEDYNFLKDKYFKLKESNEQNLQEIKNNLETIMKLKEKLEIQDKKITAYKAENTALKSQNLQLDKKNKELNKINEENEKKIFKLNKSCQRMEIDHNKLIENTVQMHQDLEELRNKLLDMQTSNFKNDLEIISSQNTGYIFNENEININRTNTEGKLPNKLIYKQKIHYKGITSISFSGINDKYITTGEDNALILLDSKTNSEITKYSEFNNIVTEACFNKNNNLILAGSYDSIVKIFSSQHLNLITNFVEHKKEVNCVKCYHMKDLGLSGSSDNTIKIWDFEMKKLVQELNYESACYSLSISSNDNFFISGHEDGVINMWTGEGEKKNKSFKLHKDKIIGVKIIKDNTFLSLGKDKEIKLFDIRKEKEIYTIKEDKITDICESNFALSPDYNNFAIGSNEGNVFIININSGEIENVINNNNGRGEVKSLNWNDFDHHIYIGDSKGFISIWGNDRT